APARRPRPSFPTRRSSDLAWLGHRFDAAAPVIRLTVLPTAAYLFYLILRSTLDAAAVKGYNSRNNVIALASAAIAVTAFLGIGRSEEHTSELQSRGHLVCR